MTGLTKQFAHGCAPLPVHGDQRLQNVTFRALQAPCTSGRESLQRIFRSRQRLHAVGRLERCDRSPGVVDIVELDGKI